MSLSKLRELVMEREAWRAAGHGVTKCRTWLSWTELKWCWDNSSLSSTHGQVLLLRVSGSGARNLHFKYVLHGIVMHTYSFLGGGSGKEPACQWRRHEMWVRLGWEDPLEDEMETRSSILASVFSLIPLCSCLENPMDKGAWQATGHGVVKSLTWLKQLCMYAHSKVLAFDEHSRDRELKNKLLTYTWSTARLSLPLVRPRGLSVLRYSSRRTWVCLLAEGWDFRVSKYLHLKLLQPEL